VPCNFLVSATGEFAEVVEEENVALEAYTYKSAIAVVHIPGDKLEELTQTCGSSGVNP